jgi:glucosamine-phosphate N-acetyltransferase
MENENNDRFCVRQLNENDFYAGYLNLLEDGFQIDPSSMGISQFRDFIYDKTVKTFIIEDTDRRIVTSASVFIEQKLIHNMGKVGHIEDVVVSSDFRGHGLGKRIVNTCLDYAKTQECYKCILDCSEENVNFYKKCNKDFQVKGVEMALYY